MRPTTFVPNDLALLKTMRICTGRALNTGEPTRVRFEFDVAISHDPTVEGDPAEQEARHLAAQTRLVEMMTDALRELQTEFPEIRQTPPALCVRVTYNPSGTIMSDTYYTGDVSLNDVLDDIKTTIDEWSNLMAVPRDDFIVEYFPQ